MLNSFPQGPTASLGNHPPISNDAMANMMLRTPVAVADYREPPSALPRGEAISANNIPDETSSRRREKKKRGRKKK